MNYGIFTVAGSAREAVMNFALGEIYSKYEGVCLLAASSGGGAPVAWVARFRRLARDHECLPETPPGLHFLTFALLMLSRLAALMLQSA